MEKANHHTSIRIFKNPLLEACTHVHPIIPLLLWTPVLAYFFYQAQFIEISFLYKLAFFFLGLVIWTLTEYLLHRFLFHFPAKNKVTSYLVFLFHGLHHDDPDDPTRLVMPPVPAILLSSILYALFNVVLGPHAIVTFFPGFLVGYLLYDYTHYAIHHFNLKSAIFKSLRRHHLVHHARGNTKFGVSSSLWDHIFKTL